MFEILTIGENPYRYSNVKNRDYKEKLKAEFEWVLLLLFLLLREISLDFLFLLREYNKTGQKNEWGLRCKDPLLVNEYQLDVFPVLDVSRDDFKALTKVEAQFDFIIFLSTKKQVNLTIFNICFQVMKSCWDIEPADRPSFRDIVNQLDGMKSYYDEN